MSATSEPPAPAGDTSGRRWRRRAEPDGPSVEELQARIVELTLAAERAAGLRLRAEQAAAEQAAERIVAEESAT
ncbi:MAG: hypothetical protein F2667_13050, partial [Actinobacteria bacterium]|nr:hypothetical protein [Actinomycetota bacterium]